MSERQQPVGVADLAEAFEADLDERVLLMPALEAVDEAELADHLEHLRAIVEQPRRRLAADRRLGQDDAVAGPPGVLDALGLDGDLCIHPLQ